MKIFLSLIGIFVISVVFITIGYFNFYIGSFAVSINLIYEIIPVFSTAFLLVVVVLFNLLLAFYTSKGSFNCFQGEIVALSTITPFFLLFFMLPGSIDIPKYLGENFYIMYIGIIISQHFMANFISKEIWRIGGREINTDI